MRFTWDEAKRETTLQKRGLDFADARLVFELGTFTWEDMRFDYDEHRFITLGVLKGDIVVVAHTETKDHIRVISMRKAEKHEQRLYYRKTGFMGS